MLLRYPLSDELPVLHDSTVVCMQIFFPGSHAAAQMTLGFVVFQNGLYFEGQCRIDLKESFGYILMDG